MAHLGEKLTEVLIRGLQKLSTSQLNPDRLLEKLRGGQVGVLYGPIEFFGEVDLHPWHTPKHTHLRGWW